MRQGEIYWVNLEGGKNIQKGFRPVILLTSNIFRCSRTITVAPISSQLKNEDMITHVVIKAGECNLLKDSVVKLEQIVTINKESVDESKKIGYWTKDIKQQVQDKLKTMFNIC